jgi:hypothetical protein
VGLLGGCRPATILAATATALVAAAAVLEGRSDAAWSPPPVNAQFDYQLALDYQPPSGVRVVTRDWFGGQAADGAYSICYVNPFQTQAEDLDVDRPDEASRWPASLVLKRLGDDPDWPGEYLVDISTAAKRRRAADHVQQMLQTCKDKGFKAVEYDNLDSWTRFDGTPVAKRVPFGKRQAVAFAELITDRAHALGLASAQKNGLDLTKRESRQRIGFDFAIAEECGRYKECGDYRAIFGDRVIIIEYRRADFRAACRAVGRRVSVVLRDRDVSAPGSDTYVYDAC